MVKIFLVLLCFSLNSFADSEFEFTSKIPEVTKKLKEIKSANLESFEDEFNQQVKELESLFEKEKSICIGEMSTESGAVVAKENRQICLRKMKGHYLSALNAVHDLKKKYLEVIYKKQLNLLNENFEKIKAQFEKNF